MCIIAQLIRLYSLTMLYRHEDLKAMLDSNKDSQKRDAMKIIIGVRSILLL